MFESRNQDECENECPVKSILSELLLQRIATPYCLKHDPNFQKKSTDRGNVTSRSKFGPSTGLRQVESVLSNDLNYQPTVNCKHSYLQTFNETNISRNFKSEQSVGLRQKLLSSLRSVSKSLQKFISGSSAPAGDPLRTRRGRKLKSSLENNFYPSSDLEYRQNETDKNDQESFKTEPNDRWKCGRKTSEQSCKYESLPQFLLKNRCNSHECACIKNSWRTIRLRAGGESGCCRSTDHCIFSKASDASSTLVTTTVEAQSKSQGLRCQPLQFCYSDCNDEAPDEDWIGINNWIDTDNNRMSIESGLHLSLEMEENRSRNDSFMVESNIDLTQSSWKKSVKSATVPIFEDYSKLIDQVEKLKKQTETHKINEDNYDCVDFNDTPLEDVNCCYSREVSTQDPDNYKWKRIKWLTWMDLSQCEDYENKLLEVRDSLTTISGNETTYVSDVYWALTKVTVYPDSSKTYEVMTGPNAQINRIPQRPTIAENVFALIPES